MNDKVDWNTDNMIFDPQERDYHPQEDNYMSQPDPDLNLVGADNMDEQMDLANRDRQELLDQLNKNKREVKALQNHNAMLESRIEEKEVLLMEIIEKFKLEAKQYKKDRQMLKNRVAKLQAEAKEFEAT